MLRQEEEASSLALQVLLFAKRTVVELMGVPAADVSQVNDEDGRGCTIWANGQAVFRMRHVVDGKKVHTVGEWLLRAAAPRLSVPTPDGTGKLRL